MTGEIVVGLFTIGGVAAGFFGQWFLERQRTHRGRAGIVRALAGEIRQNASAVVQLLYAGSRATDVSVYTWQASQFELAQFVHEDLYEEIVVLYMTLSAVAAFSREDLADRGEKLAREWIEDAKQVINNLLRLREAKALRRRPHKLGAELRNKTMEAHSPESNLS